MTNVQRCWALVVCLLLAGLTVVTATVHSLNDDNFDAFVNSLPDEKILLVDFYKVRAPTFSSWGCRWRCLRLARLYCPAVDHYGSVESFCKPTEGNTTVVRCVMAVVHWWAETSQIRPSAV